MSSPALYGRIGVRGVCGDRVKPAPKRNVFFFFVVALGVVISDSFLRSAVSSGRLSPGSTNVDVVVAAIVVT